MTDTFFTQKDCDRCQKVLTVRKMSWFTDECLCDTCVDKESELRGKLEAQGVDVAGLEGCGTMPTAGEL